MPPLLTVTRPLEDEEFQTGNPLPVLVVSRPVADEQFLAEGPVRPEGLASTAAYGTPLLSSGGVALQPAGLATSVALGTPGRTVGPVGRAPAGLPSGATLGGVTVLPGNAPPNLQLLRPVEGEEFPTDRGLQPAGLASGVALGVPGRVPGVVARQAGGVGAIAVTGAPQLMQDNPLPQLTVTRPLEGEEVPTDRGLQPLGLSSSLVLGVPAMAPGGVGRQPQGVASGVLVGTPGLEQGNPPPSLSVTRPLEDEELPASFALQPVGVPSGVGVGSPVVQEAVYPPVLTVSRPVEGEEFTAQFPLTVTRPSEGEVFYTGPVLRPEGIAPSSAFGMPEFVHVWRVGPWSITSTVSLGSPQVSGGATLQSLHPVGLVSRASVGVARVLERVEVQGVPSTATLGAPVVFVKDRIIPIGVPSAAAVGVPGVVVHRGVRPDGIFSAAAVGGPRVHGQQFIYAPFIHDSAAIGGANVRTGGVAARPRGLESNGEAGVPYLLVQSAPLPFEIPNRGELPLASLTQSARARIVGLNMPTRVEVTGDAADLVINGQPQGQLWGTVVHGDTVAVRMITPGEHASSVTCTVTILGVSETVVFTTISEPTPGWWLRFIEGWMPK